MSNPSGGFGSAPFGSVFGGGHSENPTRDALPSSALWNGFDLTGAVTPNDMTLLLAYPEVTSYGDPTQFFGPDFHMCSGGEFPSLPAVVLVDVPVTETFTVEWRVALDDLPLDFSDLENEAVLLGVNNVSGPCASVLLSEAGVAYTGAFRYGVAYDLELGHDVQVIPGSEDWFDAGDEVYVRLVVDSGQQLVSVFITAADRVTPGVLGTTDSTGHVLRALLPVIQSNTSSFPTVDALTLYVKGGAAAPSCTRFVHYNFALRAIIPKLPPRAIAGPDQAARLCSIIQLDGSGSFDPDGQPLAYEWRMVNAPDPSQYTFSGLDGRTVPQVVPSGFTDVFFSNELALENTSLAIEVGDVLLVAGVGHTIVEVPPGDTVPFFVRISDQHLDDGLSNSAYKLIRQSGLNGRDSVKPTFYPDQPGFWQFDLRVFDGSQFSTPTGLQRATTLVNVLESPLPRGCTPDLSFIYDYLSDFWKLVEDASIFHVFWGAIAQVAATEMLTLWQHQYSKSIRDIQRTFIRRWLHFDLLLGEPIPELTKVNVVLGGVESEQFTDARLNERRLVLSTPAYAEDIVVDLAVRGTLDPVSFAEGLGRYLRRFDPSFSVHYVRLRSGSGIFRIDAAFKLTVAPGTTASLFPVGRSSSTPTGFGYAVGPRTFLVDRSLQGLNLVDAFLVVGDDTYVIDRVVDVAADEYPHQRVVLREPLAATVPSDTVLPPVEWAICGWVSSELLDFYAGLVTKGDHVDMLVTEESDVVSSVESFETIVECRAYGASGTYNGRLPMDTAPIAHFVSDGTLSVRLARVVRRGRVPVDGLVVDIPVLQERVVIEDDAATLRRNLDFYLDFHRGVPCLRFASGQGGGPDVFEGQRPPNRLWAEYVYLDNGPTIEANFGFAVGLTQDQLALLPDGVDYLSAVSGLLYSHTNGPTVRNLRVGAQILLGLPFAEEDGTIEEIRRDLLSDRGRLLIRDAKNTEVVRSYSFPKVLDVEVNPATGVRYVVGDSVTRFAPLVGGVEVLDYVKNAKWFSGLLEQGLLYEPQKYHTFAVRADSRAFSLETLLFLRDFVLAIKPTHTQPRFVVEFVTSDADGDEISVNDSVSFGGQIKLEDATAARLIGGSYVLDQPWPGGGQPWTGDQGADFGFVRNRFDTDDDHSVRASIGGVVQEVAWSLDQEFLHPKDVISYDRLRTETSTHTPAPGGFFNAPFPDESSSMDVAGPLVVPPGTTGIQLPLNPPNFGAGTVRQVTLWLLGDPGTAVPLQFVASSTTGNVQVFDFVARANQEVTFDVSTPSAATTYYIRDPAGAGLTVPWVRIRGRAEFVIGYRVGVSTTPGTFLKSISVETG